MKNSADKDLIWVSKEFAMKYKEAEKEENCRDEQEKILNEYIESVKENVRRDFQANLDSLEENAAVFTGLMLKVRQSFEKAKNEHLTASYELWENYDKEKGSIKEKTEQLILSLKPLKNELNEINDLFSKIRTYEMDKVIETVKTLSGLYGTQKEMIEFLVNNFKPREVK